MRIASSLVWRSNGAVPASGNFVITAEPVEECGPLGWWHRALGIKKYREDRGSGIRIGIVDTGCCNQHMHLRHVKQLGRVKNGVMDYEPKNIGSRGTHGTHVCGIIGARPPESEFDQGLAGIAPGAELIAVKIDLEPLPDEEVQEMGEDELEKQPVMRHYDINEAISILIKDHHVDLINLSLSLPHPSAIASKMLRETIGRAADAGTLCIAAAGNDGRGTLSHPASLPEVVAVSAIGRKNTGPATRPNQFMPAPQTGRLAGKHYLASLSNYGSGLACCAPGVGIISAVPADAHDSAPYLDMTGTSMAAPMVTGALAIHLSKELGIFRSLQGAERVRFASNLLNEVCLNLGLNRLYQGKGLIQALLPRAA